MKPRRRIRLDFAPVVGLPLAIGVVLIAQRLEGGRLGTLMQATAAIVVLGGTFAALLVSYPAPTLGRALRAVVEGFGQPEAPTRTLIAQFTQYAIRTRRKGMLALEPEIGVVSDPFLSRALSLIVDGYAPVDVRHTLELDSRMREDADEESAAVLEAAAGYAPTLGILGAVLGLIQVMEHLAAPDKLGSGIAVAFVATVYGVGSANLIFMPLATRLRSLARRGTLNRDVVIEGVAAIQQGMHPRLVEQHLIAFVDARARERHQAVA